MNRAALATLMACVVVGCAGVGHETVVRRNAHATDAVTSKHYLSDQLLGSNSVACELSSARSGDAGINCGINPPYFSLSLAGGGYRATLFHYGAIKRINEGGRLRDLRLVCSTSGGSITAAALVLNWNKLNFDDRGVATNLDEVVGIPLLKLTARTADVNTAAANFATAGHARKTIGPFLERSELFEGRHMSDLPHDSNSPLLIMISTDYRNGHAFPISRDFLGNEVLSRMAYDLRVSQAISASAGFPPILGPIRFEMAQSEGSEKKIRLRSFLLGDGGIYDNLGIAYCAKSSIQYISSAANPKDESYDESDPVSTSIRTIDIMHSLLMDRLYNENCARTGRVCWSLARDVATTNLDDASVRSIFSSARIPTRLKGLSRKTQCALVNAGYISADASFIESGSRLREFSMSCE